MGYVHVPSLAPSSSVLGTGQWHCGTSAAEMKMPTADSCQPLHFGPHLHVQPGSVPKAFRGEGLWARDAICMCEAKEIHTGMLGWLGTWPEGC